jgi:ABC-2 type transport system permease protein
MSIKREPHYIRSIYIIFRKELMSYFNSPIAYIFIGAFLIVGNWLFFKTFFLLGQASLRPYFNLLPWLFMFLAPALTMRLWAEEKKMGTEEFLLTLPITGWQAVLAKFFSALFFLMITLALTFSLPLTVASMGSLDWGPVVGSYVGAVLLGGAYLAIGVFISSLTRNQIIAFIVSLAVCFVWFLIGEDLVVVGLPKFLVGIAQFIGLGQRFGSMARGVMDSRDFIYYGSLIGLFLWLNVKALEARKWL